jgi:hypothetical protein
MKRSIPPLLLVTALLASGAPAAAAAPEDFTVLAKEYAAHSGDGYLNFRERLYSGGKQVGRDRIRMVRRAKSIRAAGTFRFRDGTIFARGTLEEGRKRQRIKITDGKGAFEDVRGTLVVVGAGRKRERETFNFKP